MEGTRRRNAPMFVLEATSRWREPAWHPPADLYRTNSGWLVKVEMAGIRPADIVVTAVDHHLKIEGVRYDSTVELGYVHHSMEICYSRFERHVELPCDVRHSELASAYEDGLLLIHVTPKGQAHG